MRSVEELRIEARRLREASGNVSDPTLKQELAGRSFALAQCAEVLEQSLADSGFMQRSIRRYRAMLAAGISDATQKQIVAEMLEDLETLLASKRKFLFTYYFNPLRSHTKLR